MVNSELIGALADLEASEQALASCPGKIAVLFPASKLLYFVANR